MVWGIARPHGGREAEQHGACPKSREYLRTSHRVPRTSQQTYSVHLKHSLSSIGTRFLIYIGTEAPRCQKPCMSRDFVEVSVTAASLRHFPLTFRARWTYILRVSLCNIGEFLAMCSGARDPCHQQSPNDDSTSNNWVQPDIKIEYFIHATGRLN